MKIELLDPGVLARKNLLITIRLKYARHPIEFYIYKNWVMGPLDNTPRRKLAANIIRIFAQRKMAANSNWG